MALEVLMPRQGQSVESCIIIEWKVAEGDAVTAGQALCEVETDKATFEVEAPEAGTVLGIFYPADADVEVLKVIAAIGAPGEDISAMRPADAAPAAPAPAPKAEEPAKPAAAPAPSVQPQVSSSTGAAYDIIIIGAGPGGYEMAERAGHKGLKVLLIEKKYLGGVCLNWGCIPTKTLLNSAKHYVHAKEAPEFGVTTGEVKFDLAKTMAWKQDVIETLRGGVAAMMKKNKVEVLYGEAKLIGSRKVEVAGTVYEGDNVVIATGGSPFVPPIPGADQPHVMTSKEILSVESMPKSLAVIGGGVIGVEFASFFSSLGVKVDVIEMLDEIIPFMDNGQAAAFRKALKGKVNFNLGCRVTAIDGHDVKFVTKSGEEKSINADIVLMSVGRSPNLSGMGFEEAGLDFDRRGIKTDDQQRTNLPNVFAIGDVTGKSQLAHSATRMGEVALNTILGKKDRFRTNAIPWAVYSMPEIAGCGMTEEQATEAGHKVDSKTLPLIMSGRFLAENGKKGPGQVKVVIDADTRAILGVHAFGAYSSEFIWGVAAMIESGLRVEDAQEIVFPHPTVGEVIRSTMFQF
ncbi:Dihydrolipoyl dehydrogenase [Pontiella desulfatans]|uniref:Dihydrolipoyl dehydrogenase n=1 Tax=Pontiella desulfatans TaxID=2750659 RepID=A0A6C2TZB3_PONDE|nr:dihydrolipoyl dehydrogenase [Pontiella desulfatans]VGO12943.1 Dihydrolipoyl dehydrogenase [Pontiella desulfatans]